MILLFKNSGSPRLRVLSGGDGGGGKVPCIVNQCSIANCGCLLAFVYNEITQYPHKGNYIHRKMQRYHIILKT